MVVLRKVFALFQALLPFIGFGFFAIVSYSELPSPYNIVTAILLIILGSYISEKVYFMLVRRGIMNTITGSSASYELDDLEPIPGSGVFKLSAEEFANLDKNEVVNFTSGTVAIWGDWNGRKLNEKHEVSAIEFIADKTLLVIYFTDKCLLKIKKPSTIFYSNTYLKISNAKEILWQTPNISGSYDQYSYLNTGKIIKTQSNTNWTPHSNDLGIGIYAIYMQG